MSHSHRDEQDLAEHVEPDPEPVVVTPPAQAVANTEAERRAAERRKVEGVPEQTTEHQFTGDLPEPTRGGTEIETRLRFGDDDDEADTRAAKSAASRRGPPAPRARHVEDDVSWVAPGRLDALGTGALAVATGSWLAPTSHPAAALGAASWPTPDR